MPQSAEYFRKYRADKAARKAAELATEKASVDRVKASRPEPGPSPTPAAPKPARPKPAPDEAPKRTADSDSGLPRSNYYNGRAYDKEIQAMDPRRIDSILSKMPKTARGGS